MEMVTIEVRLPKEIYDKASEILARQGLTMEDEPFPKKRTRKCRKKRNESMSFCEMLVHAA